MNIAILSFYSGINNRGVERWVIDLASQISDKHDITIFQNGKILDRQNVEVIVTNIRYNKQTKWNKFLKVLFLDYDSTKILQFSIKIFFNLLFGKHKIIIPTDGGWESAIVRIICTLTGKKMIIVGHAGIGYDDLNNLWCFPDCFVALSSFAKDWAKKMNPFVKTVYIPDGVDVSFFTPSKKKKHQKNILCVNALTKNKRVDLIILAVSEVQNANLHIVGSGEEEFSLKKLAKSKLGDRVTFSTVSFDKMPEIYKNADLLVSASTRHFSFEMVLIEAMACNLPVIANNDPIRSEIVGNAGFLVDPTNMEDFVYKISAALIKDWGELPRKRAEDFSWVRVSNKYNSLFESVVK